MSAIRAPVPLSGDRALSLPPSQGGTPHGAAARAVPFPDPVFLPLAARGARQVFTFAKIEEKERERKETLCAGRGC
eukprot:3448318-Prymnesium_polylepis.1